MPMKNIILAFPIGLVWTLLGFFQAAPQKPADPGSAGGLEAVVKKMDATASSFRTTQAEFEWDSYEKVIDEVDDVETGTIYYRRTGNDIEMMAEVKKAGPSAAEMKPEPKYVLFSGGKIRIYQPKIDQAPEEHDLGKYKADFESYLVLGFGGSGQDLLKTFDVTYIGAETIDGVTAAKLQLVPKSQGVRNNFKRILLWVDLDKGIAVRQQLFDLQDDYRLAKYSSIRINEKIDDSVFRLKTTKKTAKKTQTVSPGG